MTEQGIKIIVLTVTQTTLFFHPKLNFFYWKITNFKDILFSLPLLKLFCHLAHLLSAQNILYVIVSNSS
jgi:hypothetical protein